MKDKRLIYAVRNFLNKTYDMTKKSRYLLLILSFLVFSYLSSAQTDQLNHLIDKWHKAAADADAVTFFGLMSDDCVYIGTDASERWVKKEFYQFAKPHFDKGEAWEFDPIERNVYFSENGKFAWFEELLDTWMGVCRGSGVLKKASEGWKICHYHLSIAVPNEKIDEYLELIKVEKQERP